MVNLAAFVRAEVKATFLSHTSDQQDPLLLKTPLTPHGLGEKVQNPSHAIRLLVFGKFPASSYTVCLLLILWSFK